MNLVTSIATVVALALPSAALAHGPNPPELDRCGDLRDVDALTGIYLDVLNSRDVSRFDEICSEDYVNRNPVATVEGLDNFKALMQQVFVGFPDITYSIDATLVDGNQVTYHYSWVGTHLGTFFGVPATGNVVHGRGMEIDIFEDGLMVETINYADLFGMFVQIGAIPGF